jgi:glycine/D-amino acid oxidase-like deaminating enzyme
MPKECDLAIIGAGMTGAACAWYAVNAGLHTVVIDRGPVAGGTTGAGEGNLLLSDKEPGPELELAMLASRLWREIAELPGFAATCEYEAKGGLVVAEQPDALAELEKLAAAQRTAGVRAEPVASEELAQLEPHLVRGLAGGVFYPQDAQVQPARAAAWLLRDAVRRGATLLTGTTVIGIVRPGGGTGAGSGTGGRRQKRAGGGGDAPRSTGAAVEGDSPSSSRAAIGVGAPGSTGAGARTRVRSPNAAEVIGLVTDHGTLTASRVLNAAGTWGAEVAELAGVDLPVLPRRGFILVTEPLPRLVRHKVYAADRRLRRRRGQRFRRTPVLRGRGGHGGRTDPHRREP